MDKKKILVVDDEPGFVDMIKLRLEANGYNVVTACDGEEALGKMSENPDLILLDVMMPRLDGYSFVRKIKASAGRKTVPVVIMTAKPDMKDLFQMEGIEHYLVKPVENEELVAMVRKILGE